MKKLPIGIQDFSEVIKNGYFYVDKTKQLFDLIQGKSYFLSKPRRFGKSLMISVMRYLFGGRRELFEGLRIQDKRNREETNPVMHISFAHYTKNDTIVNFIEENLTIYDEKQKYNALKKYKTINIHKITEQIFEQTGKQTVILIDEYDKPIQVNIQNKQQAEELRLELQSFYAPVKDSDQYIRLFFLSGLTKLLKMSIFSVLNHLDDITYDRRFYDLMGYSDDELDLHFTQDFQELSDEMGMSYEQFRANVREYYNGYNFGKPKNTMYNPRNINQLLIKGIFGPHWTGTGIPSAISNFIQINREKVFDMCNRLATGEIGTSKNGFVIDDLERLNAEILFYYGGYLTVKEVKDMGETYMLGFPNKETEHAILGYFMDIAIDGYNDIQLKKIANGLITGLLQQDAKALTQTLDNMLHTLLPNTAYERLAHNKENTMKTLIGMVLHLNRIYYIPEVQNIEGRTDLIVLKGGKAYIMEVKIDETPAKALQQIDDTYISQFVGTQYENHIIKVGINLKWEDKKFEVETHNNASNGGA